MNNKLLLAACITIAFTLSMALPADAFYFEFIYFETDKMVYEVGEEINMVASLVADFSETGWCFVSFSVVTDAGPIFDSSYFIGSSPVSQLVRAEYTILPSETSPGATGVDAYVTFNVEIYDKYSQAGSDTIQVNITRGHLKSIPLSSLEVESGCDSTVDFRIACEHNDAVVLENSSVRLLVTGPESQTMYDTMYTTNHAGEFSATVPSMSWSPGTYNMTLSTVGSEDFLPLNESWNLTVVPRFSKLTITRYDDQVYCQSADELDWDQVNLTVLHSDNDNNHINDSIVTWATEFSSGMMTSLGDGFYQTIVDFKTNPGVYTLNITSQNPAYQEASCTFAVNVIHRPLDARIGASEYTAGHVSVIQVATIDLLTNQTVCFLPIMITLTVNGTPVYIAEGITDSNGIFNRSIDIPSDIWGPGELSIRVTQSPSYSMFNTSIPLQVDYQPLVVHELLTPQIIGHTTTLIVTLCDSLQQPLVGAVVELRDSDGSFITSGNTNLSGIVLLDWIVPLDEGPGTRGYRIVVPSDSFRYILETIYYWNSMAYCPLKLVQTEMPAVTRGTSQILSFIVISEYSSAQSLNVTISDLLGEFFLEAEIITDTSAEVLLFVPESATLGVHRLGVVVHDATLMLIDSSTLDVIVLGHMTCEISSETAYYGETLQLHLNIRDDLNSTPSEVSLVLYADIDTIFTHSAFDCEETLSIPLPLSLLPGHHSFILTLSGAWLVPTNKTIDVLIWMRTYLTIELHPIVVPPIQSPIITQNHDCVTAASISAGSIMSPPPILFNGTTSATPLEARETSPTSCPRFISGTSNLSTVLANDRTSESGNGQTVLSRMDFSRPGSEFILMTSSTDRELQPKETTPHSACSGPSTTTSVRIPWASTIFDFNLRTR